MGSAKMDSKTAKSETVSSYTILSIPGIELPNSYKNLVFSKWLRSLRYGNDYFKLIDSDSYYKTYHAFIDLLLHKPETLVRLAVLTEDNDVVLGFSVCRGNILDYVHTHKDMRKQGIATSLVPSSSINTITHLTKTGMSIWNSKLKDVLFNPFA